MKNDIPTPRSDRNMMRHHNTVARQTMRREAAQKRQAERDARTDQEQLDMLIEKGHASNLDGIVTGCSEALRLAHRISKGEAK